MPQRRARTIAFMAAWTVFWLAAMFLALWLVGDLVRAGEAAPLVFMALWLAAAGYGLYRAALRLVQLVAGERLRPGRRRGHRRHNWEDDLPRGDR